MPLFGRKEFQPLDVPADVKPETEVFHLPITNEVFIDYDAYFERIVHLNSSVWTCAITYKPGLTYDEARESEENALKQIDDFPAALERVILFVVHCFCGRTRLEDLVNDLFVFLKDRYFVDEELQLKRKNRRVRVLGVRHVGVATSSTSQTNVAKRTSTAAAVDDKGGKIMPPEAPAPQCYRYRVRVIEDEDDSPASFSADSDNEEAREGEKKTQNGGAKQNGVPGIYEDVKFSDLTRERYAITKGILKLIIRYYTETTAQKLDVKKQHISDLMLDTIQWTNFFDGPLPVFQQTIRAAPLKAVKEKSQKQLAGAAKKIKKESIESNEENVKSNNKKPPSAHSPRKAKSTMVQKMIKQQQIDLAPLLAAAEKCGVENLERWRQDIALLAEEDIQQLRDEVKEAKEAERRRNILKAVEKRRKQRETLMEWKKPRDDLQCDDLKPLPKYEEFVLPDWVPADLYYDLLSVHNFFYSFSELIIGGSLHSPFTLSTIAKAVLSREPENNNLVDVLRTLLKIRTDCADEEDGDEADVDNSEELGYIYNCDMDHKQYGQLIREKSRLHESLRNTFGASVRHLPVTSMTLTEVVRLTLETSGYYASGNLKVRQQARGIIRCYDDDGFHFTLQRADIMEKLRISSIYELSPKDRLAIINVFIQQLLSYVKFRDVIDERINGVYDLRRDLRNLREFDRTQEREAREVHAAKETIAKAGTSTTTAENIKASKTLQKLRRYLKHLNEGGVNRTFNDANSKQTLLEAVPYAEMNIHEVEEFRELQRGIIRELQQSYLQKIFSLQERMGWQLLGRDRAYRSYYFLQQFNLFIIEKPVHEDIEETCQEPTPLGQEFEEKNDPAAEDAKRAERLGCNGKSNTCSVHSPDVCSTDGRRKWHYFVQEDGIDRLFETLNSRGFREIELIENLMFFKELYEERMAKVAEKASRPDFLRRLFELPTELNDSEEYLVDENAIEMAMRDKFRQQLLEMEEKLFSKNIGAVECKDDDRDEWRRALEENGDTTNLCPDNRLCTYDGVDMLMTAEQLDRLSNVEKLAVAFLQIVNGVEIECILEPFSGEDKKTQELLPTTLFISWQQELLRSKSISQLALFLTSFIKSIQWKAIVRCHTCNKIINGKSAQCCGCKKIFHFACVKLRVKTTSKELRSWRCTDCAKNLQKKNKKAAMNSAQNGRASTDEDNKESDKMDVDDDAKAETSYGVNDESAEEGEDESEGDESSYSLHEDDDDYKAPSSSGFRTRSGASTKSAGTKSRPAKVDVSTSKRDDKRSFKKMLANGHAESETNGSDEFGGRKRRAAAKRFIDYVYADERSATEESGSESPASFGQAAKTARRSSLRSKTSTTKSSNDSFNYRHVSMGLRESDDQRRSQLKRCEAIIRDAMTKPFGDAFAFPVDAKYVPHYYDVIKNPMDLRTMINKLKNYEYDTAADLWADCRLMFDNCVEFNEPESSIRQDAEKLEEFLMPRFVEVIGHPID